MSDEQNTDTENKSPQQMPQGAQMPLVVHAQYLRDMSFENPNAPDTLRAGQDAPEMDINIGMDARKLEDPEMDSLYEVVLNIRAEATREAGTVFICEMQYGVTVSVSEVPEEQHHPLLLIEVPRLAFPYVRQLMSEATQQGGFPPLLLAPVDFQALYMERFKDEIAAAQAEAQGTA